MLSLELYMRFGFLTAMSFKMSLFSSVMPGSSVDRQKLSEKPIASIFKVEVGLRFV